MNKAINRFIKTTSIVRLFNISFRTTLVAATAFAFTHSSHGNTSQPSSEIDTQAKVSSATSNPPVVFTAHYNANIKGFSVKASRELSRLDNGQFSLSFDATSWAAEVKELSTFNWADGKVQPVSYRYFQTAFGKKREQSITFNRTENTIASDNNGDKHVITQTAQTLDKLNYQLQLQQDLLAGHSGLAYTIIDKGRLKNYRFEKIGEETTDTNSGSLDTIKVKVIRENKEKTTYIWFAKNWNNLLVKLEQYNGDKQTLAINLDSATVNNIPVQGK